MPQQIVSLKGVTVRYTVYQLKKNKKVLRKTTMLVWFSPTGIFVKCSKWLGFLKCMNKTKLLLK